jgi:hypothetical protein
MKKNPRQLKSTFAIIILLLFGVTITLGQEKNESIERISFQEILAKSSKSAGSTGFNVVDRIAIRNLLAAYCMTYDEQKIDPNADLFWPEAEFIVDYPDKEDLIITKASWVGSITERFKVFKEMDLQRRHIMGEVLFLDENENFIHTINNGLAISVINQKDTSLSLSLLYETWFEKREDVWKIVRFKIILDGVVDVESEVKK